MLCSCCHTLALATSYSIFSMSTSPSLLPFCPPLSAKTPNQISLTMSILSLQPQLPSFTEKSPLLRLRSPQHHGFRYQREMSLLYFQFTWQKAHAPQALSHLLPPSQQMTCSVWVLRKRRPPGRGLSARCFSTYTLPATQTHPSLFSV